MSQIPTTVYQHHLSGEVRIFRFPASPVVDSTTAVVFDSVAYNPEPTYCRVYLFLKRWLQVFITFDDQMNLKPDPIHAFGFAFNCDITTPHHRSGNILHTSDVCLDVCVQADGKTYRIEDRMELDESLENGLIGRQWYQYSVEECDRLESEIQNGRFISCLEAVAPFPKSWEDLGANSVNRKNINKVYFQYHPTFPRFQ